MILFTFWFFPKLFQTHLLGKKTEKKKKSQGSFEGKALCDTVSVTQINQIKELQHSVAESLIIIQANTHTHAQVCNVVILKAL